MQDDKLVPSDAQSKVAPEDENGDSVIDTQEGIVIDKETGEPVAVDKVDEKENSY